MDHENTPAFRCVDGVLHINAAWSDMRIQWRPFVRAEEKDRQPRRRWKEFWPDFRILRPADKAETRAARDDIGPALIHSDDAGDVADAKLAAFTEFRKEVPEQFAAVAETFASHQWAPLKLLREEKTFRDLAKANPILAYCLANNGEFRGTDAKIGERLAIPHSHAKQREILQWLGFPGTPAMVKLFKKITSATVTPFTMRCLRAATQRDERAVTLLSHQNNIGTGVLTLACSRHTCDLVTPKLIAEVAAGGLEETESPTADCLDHAVQLLQEMRSDRKPRPFLSCRRVRQFHDDVAEEYEIHKERVAAAHKERLRKKYAFQRPPIPGTDTIVPIVSELELKQEGKSQGHCVASYDRSVRSGKTYIYKVLAPERATLSIVRASDGCWRRSELKAKSNRAVSPQTAATVDRWLYGHSLSV